MHSRTPAHREQFARDLSASLGLDVVAAPDLGEAARDLEVAFTIEQRNIFPQILSLHHGRPLRPEV